MDYEQQLIETKWFDYKPLPPDTATLAFIVEHAKGLVRQLEYLGEEGAYYKATGALFGSRGLKRANPTAWKHWKLFERLRQRADERCMRYDLFWAMAFEAYNEFGWGTRQTKRKSCFVPFNYFTSKALLSRVFDGWEEYRRQFLVKSHIPFLRAEAFTGHPFQVGYWRYVADEIKRRYPRKWYERLDEMRVAGEFPSGNDWLAFCTSKQ